MRCIFGQVWLIRKFRTRTECLCDRFLFLSLFAVSTAGLVSTYTWLPQCLATGAHRPHLHSPSSCPYLWQPIISTRGTLDDELVNKPGEAGLTRTDAVRLFCCIRSLACTINIGTQYFTSQWWTWVILKNKATDTKTRTERKDLISWNRSTKCPYVLGEDNQPMLEAPVGVYVTCNWCKDVFREI